MSHKTGMQRRGWKQRALCLLLAAVMLAGLTPGLTLSASADHWADPYLDQLVDWGIMRSDQAGNPDADLTRAEFMAIVNRAYGYHEKGEIPFTDVATTDWFYDDVAIAYTAGYISGTSPTTASPNDPLTREQAAFILGRNMMMKETPGESLAFSDSRDVSDWARGVLKTAVNNYVISGYPDNTFRPQGSISKGQMAAMVTQCLGRPIQDSGEHELGGVFGNVTITSPGVTLRDTTISGDLYVSGGVGLGGIKLENVNVLGRIIISSSGESESGQASVVMRNVAADEMLVDNMRNKLVTVRADGITDIGKTTVRTSAYIEDNNTDDRGLLQIDLDGEDGTNLTLAGRIKEVVNKTPNSQIQVAKGTVAKLTVDEDAVNSAVQLEQNTQAKELNLDVAANVDGAGSIAQLNVNAPDSTVAILPDQTYVRPGITSTVSGVVTDHAAAEEGSLDPRLLSGYPAASDIAPTAFRADFSGNKKGTVYWAVSAAADGSIGEDALITPPSYGSKALKNGSVPLTSGGTVANTQVTGLTVGGSYYLSAILVDDQGKRSPVKVASFATPDNTVPAFGQGYPYLSFVGKEYETDARITAQVTVMPTKDCRLYYAVMPQGGKAPTKEDMKAASVSGNLGYGVVPLNKNEELPIIVSRQLEEQKSYTLYLWLTDVDGTNNSAVSSLAVSTPDITPPYFVMEPYLSGDAQTNSVPLSAVLNENGTIYWVAVPSGEAYPKPNNQRPADNVEGGATAKLDSSYAKLQVSSGMNAQHSGRVTATADREVKFNITGLEAEKSYDLYYLAQDQAGNYSAQVEKLEGSIRTKDTQAPTVRQFFTKFDGTDNTKSPLLDTGIVLEFSENICFEDADGRDLLGLYQDTQTGTSAEKEAAKTALAKALRGGITMYDWSSGFQNPAKVKGDSGAGDSWVIDYTQAKVVNENGKVQLTFPKDALQLRNGGIYNFAIEKIKDLSGHAITPAKVDFNTPASTGHSVPQFTVSLARINLTDNVSLSDNQIPAQIKQMNENSGDAGKYKVDYLFRMSPEDTGTVSDTISYDLLIWTDTIGITYDLYFRAITENNTIVTAKKDNNNFLYAMPNMSMGIDDSGWAYLGSSGPHYFNNGAALSGKSLHGYFNKCTESTFPRLNKLPATTQDSQEKVYYEFAISIREMNRSSNPNNWSGAVSFYVDAAAGTSANLASSGMGKDLSTTGWETFAKSGLNNSGGDAIGVPNKPAGPAGSDPAWLTKRLHMTKTFTDSLQPSFQRAYPNFSPVDESLDTGLTKTMLMNLALTRTGTVYYVIGYADTAGLEPANDETRWNPSVTTTTENGITVTPSMVPNHGGERDEKLLSLKAPEPDDIQHPDSWNEGSKTVAKGQVSCTGVAPVEVRLPGLEANRTYYAYFVITGSGTGTSAVEMFKFKTDPISRPVISLSPNNQSKSINMVTDMNATLTYLLYPEKNLKLVTWMNDQTPLTSAGIINPDYANRLPAAYTNYQNNGPITVYQALMTPYSYEEASARGTSGAYFPTDSSGDPENFKKAYSVFDIYASDDAKSKFKTWLERKDPGVAGLTGTSPGTPTQDGILNMTKDRTNTGGDKAEWDTSYYIITMACRNPLPGDSKTSIGLLYSFMGQEITLSDQDPPELTSAVVDFQVDDTGKIKSGGTITLSFDKALWFDNSGTLTQLTDTHLSKVFNPASGIDLTATASTVTVSNNRTTVILSLKANSDEAVSATVGNSVLKNSGNVPADKLLRISRNQWPETTTAGNTTTYTYEITVTWGGSEIGSGTATREESTQTPATTSIAPAPVLQSANGNLRMDSGSQHIQSGTINLNFDQALYLEDGKTAVTGLALPQLFSSVEGINLAGSTVIHTAAGTTIKLELEQASQNVSATLAEGKVANSDGVKTEQALTITGSPQTTTNGTTILSTTTYQIDVKWGQTPKGSITSQ